MSSVSRKCSALICHQLLGSGHWPVKLDRCDEICGGLVQRRTCSAMVVVRVAVPFLTLLKRCDVPLSRTAVLIVLLMSDFDFVRRKCFSATLCRHRRWSPKWSGLTWLLSVLLSLASVLLLLLPLAPVEYHETTLIPFVIAQVCTLTFRHSCGHLMP